MIAAPPVAGVAELVWAIGAGYSLPVHVLPHYLPKATNIQTAAVQRTPEALLKQQCEEIKTKRLALTTFESILPGVAVLCLGISLVASGGITALPLITLGIGIIILACATCSVHKTCSAFNTAQHKLKPQGQITSGDPLEFGHF